MPAAVLAAGQGGDGDGADVCGSFHAAVGEDAWPSQRGDHSLQLPLAFPRAWYSHQGLGCAVEGHPLHLRGPEWVPAAAVVVVAGVVAVAVAAAAAAAVAAAAGTCSSC